MNVFSIREAFKRALMRRFDIERVDLDRLICRHAAVTMRTTRAGLSQLMERLAPVDCPDLPLIRMGGSGDGGYLLPDDLEGIDACFSPGVGALSAFEKDCAERGMDVFMADKSVAGPSETHANFHFMPKYVGALTNDDTIALDDWVAGVWADPTSDLLLQMDIEGAEYEVLLRLSDRLLQRFRVVIIEFHQLDQLHDEAFFRFASKAFEKLLLHHRCVHIHPNNISTVSSKQGLEIPSTMEFTLVRTDRLTRCTPALTFPHPLDADCTEKPCLTLPECWRGTVPSPRSCPATPAATAVSPTPRTQHAGL